jgi:hypothetical protein
LRAGGSAEKALAKPLKRKSTRGFKQLFRDADLVQTPFLIAPVFDDLDE